MTNCRARLLHPHLSSPVSESPTSLAARRSPLAMMPSSQSPVGYALHLPGEFGDPILPVPVDRIVTDRRRLHHRDGGPHTGPPRLASIGNTRFVDFSFPFQHVNRISAVDESPEREDHLCRPYHPLVEDAARDHHGPAISTGTRLGSAGPPVQAQDGSVEGSDDASPNSHHARRESITDGLSDELGLSRSAAGDGSDLGSKMKDEKDGPMPPWSELKTKAGKERKRLPLACIACRRKKIRCSGEKPACKHCLKSRIPCVYKATARKAAPRTDYMAMLDKRLKRMEERIIKVVPKDEHDSTAVTRAQVRPGIPGSMPVRTGNSKKRAADETSGLELETWAKLAPNEKGEGGIPGSLLLQEAEENRLLSEGSEAVPSQEIQEHLAEVFFENIYGQAYHLLHKPSFMRKLRAGTVPPVLILSVCAVSSRFSTHPKLNSSPVFLRGEVWAAKARDIVMKHYDWPNITILTCLLILGLHEFGTCYGGRSWAVGGMAIRMAYALQLHKDLDHDPHNTKAKTRLSFVDREIRRRTMWACFLMDRFNSSGTDRPMFTREETINVQLPIAEKYFQLEIEGPTEDLQGRVLHPVPPDSGQLSDVRANMGVAAYMIRSIALWGRIIIYLFQGGRELDGRAVWDPEAKFVDLETQADEFTRSLPSCLKYSPDNLTTHDTEGLSNQFLFLHISAQQNILFLNHFAVYGHRGGRPPKDSPSHFVAKTSANSFEAAKRISRLLKDAESYSVTAPFVGYCAFLSGSVQIAATFSKNRATKEAAEKNLATNVRYLSKMKKYWGTFHWTSKHLKEQFNIFSDAAHQGETSQTPTSVYQYSDWFDRYPHGVSQSDLEDAATTAKKKKDDDAVLDQKPDYRPEAFGSLAPANAEPARPAKRRSTKKGLPSSGRPSAISTPAAPPLTPSLCGSHVTPTYSQASPTDGVGVFRPPAYYGPELLLPPNPPGVLPQLDRQLVFGAYAGMDQAPLSAPASLMDSTAWDMAMDGATATLTEPTSAWFMPFNLEPPELGQDADIFAYGAGGMMAHPSNGMGGSVGP